MKLISILAASLLAMASAQQPCDGDGDCNVDARCIDYKCVRPCSTVCATRSRNLACLGGEGTTTIGNVMYGLGRYENFQGGRLPREWDSAMNAKCYQDEDWDYTRTSCRCPGVRPKYYPWSNCILDEIIDWDGDVDIGNFDHVTVGRIISHGQINFYGEISNSTVCGALADRDVEFEGIRKSLPKAIVRDSLFEYITAYDDLEIDEGAVLVNNYFKYIYSHYTIKFEDIVDDKKRKTRVLRNTFGRVEGPRQYGKDRDLECIKENGQKVEVKNNRCIECVQAAKKCFRNN